MNSLKDPTQNHLLATLLNTARLAPHLKLVAMFLGDILYERGCEVHEVYFPVTAVVSLQCLLEKGGSIQIAAVGNEGMVGTSLLMGTNIASNRAIVLSDGYGYTLSSDILLRTFDQAGAEMQLLLRYTQVQIMQIAQTAVCNPRHSIEQQLCRLLLMTLDRMPGKELIMTHELIAATLGARRERVTILAGKLQELGFIQYRRGHIIVVDRTGLESLVCECYGAVKREFARLLPDVSQEKPA
ncbi:MAG: Crp/Fnr family transcriptional regulator [Burkholderiales bacterium]|nr:Crp/Fnr family transcriptional regulator [Burkholderiales bacterium]